MHSSPIVAGARMWTLSQMALAVADLDASSTMAVGWMRSHG